MSSGGEVIPPAELKRLAEQLVLKIDPDDPARVTRMRTAFEVGLTEFQRKMMNHNREAILRQRQAGTFDEARYEEFLKQVAVIVQDLANLARNAKLLEDE